MDGLLAGTHLLTGARRSHVGQPEPSEERNLKRKELGEGPREQDSPASIAPSGWIRPGELQNTTMEPLNADRGPRKGP